MESTPMDRAGMGRAGLKSYVVGFLLSIILTTLAFALVVAGGNLARGLILAGILGAAMLQILVHLHYFLHLDTSSAARWNVLALVCTLIIMILFVGGTLWIMSNLNARMM
jgi:cytochrome o ubiquinol oxidase operon protein cyoD